MLHLECHLDVIKPASVDLLLAQRFACSLLLLSGVRLRRNPMRAHPVPSVCWLIALARTPLQLLGNAREKRLPIIDAQFHSSSARPLAVSQPTEESTSFQFNFARTYLNELSRATDGTTASIGEEHLYKHLIGSFTRSSEDLELVKLTAVRVGGHSSRVGDPCVVYCCCPSSLRRLCFPGLPRRGVRVQQGGLTTTKITALDPSLHSMGSLHIADGYLQPPRPS